ncbi:hypothetical protein J6590_069063 [Homalodisca vitripennis]|nr:hypothetical protein J6590_069063 [Homalodisca vitripennis]
MFLSKLDNTVSRLQTITSPNIELQKGFIEVKPRIYTETITLGRAVYLRYVYTGRESKAKKQVNSPIMIRIELTSRGVRHFDSTGLLQFHLQIGQTAFIHCGECYKLCLSHWNKASLDFPWGLTVEDDLKSADFHSIPIHELRVVNP